METLSDKKIIKMLFWDYENVPTAGEMPFDYYQVNIYFFLNLGCFFFRFLKITYIFF